jgi:hypothetical protein
LLFSIDPWFKCTMSIFIDLFHCQSLKWWLEKASLPSVSSFIRINGKCRMHIGDSTSSHLQGSIPTVLENP